MGDDLNEILSYIKSETQKEIEAIRSEEARQIEMLRKQAERDYLDEKERMESAAAARKEEIKRTVLGSANLEVKKAMLSARRELMDEVIELTYSRFNDMSSEEYSRTMKALLTKEGVIAQLDGIIKTIEAPPEGEEENEEEEESYQFEMEGDRYVVHLRPSSSRSDIYTEGFISDIEKTYVDSGLRVRLKLSSQPTERRHGAVLSFGPIEIDVTLDGMMETLMPHLERIIYEELFGESDR